MQYVLGYLGTIISTIPMKQTMPSISPGVKNQGAEDIGTRTRIQLGGA